MFKLNKLRNTQIIGFLIVFLIILTFLPLIFSGKDHKIDLKQQDVEYVTDESLDDDGYQDLNTFIAQNDVDVQEPQTEITEAPINNAQALPQHKEVEDFSESNSFTAESTVTPAAIDDKASIDNLIQNIEAQEPTKKEMTQTVPAPTPAKIEQTETAPSVSIKTEKVETSRIKNSYYVRLAALSRADYVEEKLQLLRKNNYVTKTRKSGEFTVLLVGPYNSKKEADAILPKLIKIGFKDAKVVND